ncbi:hypothetical protein HALO32_01581 [Halomonas lysinitropha]|uniref:Uncharacterized protein n=1 Tax=Halomonas lysinitropha TaxID=2607506 RepID=A0A5K1I6H0_9GAMM|nr:hypothetical protein HALO32_01581 [Halomonas lysinitropha]
MAESTGPKCRSTLDAPLAYPADAEFKCRSKT